MLSAAGRWLMLGYSRRRAADRERIYGNGPTDHQGFITTKPPNETQN
jgi:hypothetical protein